MQTPASGIRLAAEIAWRSRVTKSDRSSEGTKHFDTIKSVFEIKRSQSDVSISSESCSTQNMLDSSFNRGKHLSPRSLNIVASQTDVATHDEGRYEFSSSGGQSTNVPPTGSTSQIEITYVLSAITNHTAFGWR